MLFTHCSFRFLPTSSPCLPLTLFTFCQSPSPSSGSRKNSFITLFAYSHSSFSSSLSIISSISLNDFIFFFVEKFINLLLYVNSVLGICKFLKILGSSDNAHCTVQLKLCSHACAVPVQLNMCVRCVLATCVGNISQLLQIAISCFHFPRQHMYASAAQTVFPP